MEFDPRCRGSQRRAKKKERSCAFLAGALKFFQYCRHRWFSCAITLPIAAQALDADFEGS